MSVNPICRKTSLELGLKQDCGNVAKGRGIAGLGVSKAASPQYFEKTAKLLLGSGS